MDLNGALTPPGEPSLTAAPCAVLDTNAVLDWLLFEDPSMAGLAAALAQRRSCWVATRQMRDEFSHVLASGLAAARGRDPAPLLAAWDRHVTLVPTAARHTLRCRDGDDQMFVDLALAAGARWLVSRDRAVLALRRRADALGLKILRPADWRPE